MADRGETRKKNKQTRSYILEMSSLSRRNFFKGFTEEGLASVEKSITSAKNSILKDAILQKEADIKALQNELKALKTK